MSIAAYGEVLAAQDVVVGTWEPDTRTFTSGLDPLNAVMTTTRQQEASDTAVPAFLGGIAGFSSYDPKSTALSTCLFCDDLFPIGFIMSLIPDEAQAFYISGTPHIPAHTFTYKA